MPCGILSLSISFEHQAMAVVGSKRLQKACTEFSGAVLPGGVHALYVIPGTDIADRGIRRSALA